MNADTTGLLTHTRRALAALAPDLNLTALPLEGWVELAVQRSVHSPETSGSEGWLPAATSLGGQLQALAVLPPGPQALALLELALLTDGLDPDSACLGALQRDLHRRVLSNDRAPMDHASCLLRQGAPLRWALLGHPHHSARIATRAEDLLHAVEPAHAPAAHAIHAALEQQRTRLSWAAMTARLSQPDPASLLLEAMDRAETLATPAPFLRDRCQAAWEQQRAGVLGRAPLAGDLFVPLLMLEALAWAGFDHQQWVHELLSARLSQGLRYYRDCPWMPHDADDAAAVLLVAPEHQGLDTLRDEAMEVLRIAQQPSGAIHTWVQLPGHQAEPSPDSWYGQICAGVAARALRAMLACPDEFSTEQLGATTTWLQGLAESDGGFEGVYYPCRVVCTGLVVMALAAVHALDRSDGPLSATLKSACHWLMAQQDLDGSWRGGVEATASAVLALEAANSLAPPSAADAAAWLARTQQWDGSWAGGEFMLCPQGDGELGPFGNRALASAMALAALGSARRALVPSLAAPGSA